MGYRTGTIGIRAISLYQIFPTAQILFAWLLLAALPVETYAAEKNYIETTIEFPHQELKLVGTLITPDTNKPSPIVLILHGMSGDRNGANISGSSKYLFTRTARVMAENGIASLRFSTSGRGGSQGSFYDMTLERRISETMASVRWIETQKQFDLDQISILGHSQGSLIAISAAARLRETYPIKSIVLWAPQSNALSSYRGSMGELTYQQGLTAGPEEIIRWRGTSGKTRAFRRGFFQGLAKLRTLDELEVYKGRLLAITGKFDRWATKDTVQIFALRHHGNTKLIELDVGHRMGAAIGINAVNQVITTTLDWLKN